MTAGSAVSTGSLASLLEIADELPCADIALLAPLKRSPEYAAIRRRVGNPKPVDAWQANMVHYFVFELRRPEEAPATVAAPVALFTMKWEDDGPHSALVITPDAEGKQAEVVNLRQREIVQIVLLSDATKIPRQENA